MPREHQNTTGFFARLLGRRAMIWLFERRLQLVEIFGNAWSSIAGFFSYVWRTITRNVASPSSNDTFSDPQPSLQRRRNFFNPSDSVVINTNNPLNDLPPPYGSFFSKDGLPTYTAATNGKVNPSRPGV